MDESYPQLIAPNLHLVDGTNSEQETPDTKVSFEDGAVKVEGEDGSVTIDFDPKSEADDSEEGFYENLAKRMSDDELGKIASELLEGIQADEDSRQEWLETRSRGIKMLGLHLDEPRSDGGSASAPLEGMSTIRHPLLLGATTTFQATARAELLPAAGPVKVRNDAPMPPQDLAQTNAQQALAESLQKKDDLAQALEVDINHYLTYIATEYVPDTDRMLFYVGFGGDGFKKVYNCPLRRRPVSESVDAEDLIVSNAATDLQNCSRITHRIKMRKSVLRRMQLIGAYLDIEIPAPSQSKKTPVDEAKQEISGVRQDRRRREDEDYEILECYCELDLDEFAPKEYKGKGLPLPYRVTIAREARKILDVRRNWKEDDDQCIAKRFFVQFPFIRGLGFYGLGYIHLLGNTTATLTAAWREMLDAGMFASFPGFLYAKGAGRQLSNQFRVPPGAGIGLDVGAQQNIRDAIMPLPYKEPGAAFTTFITHVEEVGNKLASTASIQVGEGKQDAPVGTTLALIEQASKLLDSSHKRLHAAQAEEFKLLKERFRDDPESFWRHNKRPTIQWKKDQFIEALNTCELVPVADPNNPTSLHRIAKAAAIKQLQQGSPMRYDPIAVDMRVLRIMGIDPQGLFRAQPAQPPPDPRLVAIQQKAQAEQRKAQIAQLESRIKAAELPLKYQDRQADRAMKERIEQMKIQLEGLRVQEEMIIHAHDRTVDTHQTAQEMALDRAKQQQEMQSDAIAQQHEMHGGIVKSAHELAREQQHHDAKMQRDHEEHMLKMEHMRELHQEKLAAARKLASVKPKAKKDNSDGA